MLLGYLGQGELEFCLLTNTTSAGLPPRRHGSDCSCSVRLVPHHDYQDDTDEETIQDMSGFVDRTPLTLSSAAPLEHAVEMFGKLGLRYLMVTQHWQQDEDDGNGSGAAGRVVGVVIKKRLVDFLERLKEGGGWEDG